MRFALAFFFGLVATSSGALACASCGSGGDAAVSLCPFETWKFSLAASRMGGFKNVDHSGNRSKATFAPKYKDALTLAVGHLFLPELYGSVSMASLQNVGDGRVKRGFSDPSAQATYVALMQRMDAEWIPQIKLSAGYKPQVATSVLDSEDDELLDIFGSGFNETKLDAELWWGMSAVKYSLSQAVVFSSPRTIDGVKLEPAALLRTSLATGIGFDTFGDIMIGALRESRGERKQDGTIVTNSDELNHSVYLTASYKFDPMSSVKVTLTRRAAFLSNKNTTEMSGASLAYLQSF